MEYFPEKLSTNQIDSVGIFPILRFTLGLFLCVWLNMFTTPITAEHLPVK